MKIPLKSDGQWPETVAKKKVVLVHSYGPQNNDKVKEPANKVAVLPQKPSAWQGCWNERNRRFFYSCWVLKNRNQKVKEMEWEMWRTGRGGIDGLKNRSGKEREWEMWRTGQGGIDGLKNWSGKCEGPARGDRLVKEPESEMGRTGRGGSTG